MRRYALAIVLLSALAGRAVLAQNQLGFDSVVETRRALALAQEQGEAAIAASEARLVLIETQRRALARSLAARQQPVVRLTGALQRLSRRPLLLSLLRPGSVQDTVHLRAVLSTILPQVERKTAVLRSELRKGEALRQAAHTANRALKSDEAELAARRSALTALETRQRLASRSVSGIADRENERALALADQAGDLGALVDSLGQEGALRDRLAALPGPIMRPARPLESQVISATEAPVAVPAGLPGYMLPVAGQLVAGFDDLLPDGLRSRGLSLAARSGAQAVAPAAGRIAFAGLYRGFGAIVIVEHEGGWSSLITGLAEASVRVGDEVVTGAPLGVAGAGKPILGLELRRDGVPVNPLELLGSR